MSDIGQIRLQLQPLTNPAIAEQSKRYLKSPYCFYGIRVPQLRAIAKQFRNLDIYNAYNLFDELWSSKNHEEMNLAIFILQNHKKKFNRETWAFLTQKLEKAKTWDHVDALCNLLGYMLAQDVNLNTEIRKLSNSGNPWIRRASIVSCSDLIRQKKLELVFELGEKLVYDENIYVQKGAGWMLREAGKRNRIAVHKFLLMHLDMKPSSFAYATEKMKEVRKIRKQKLDERKKRVSN